MDFPRQSKKKLELPLTPMIDVVFILIVFFMLTTSFMKVESLELMLPSSGAAGAEKSSVARVFIDNSGSLSFGSRKVEAVELQSILRTSFAGGEDQKVVLFSAEKVSMQKLVDVMDMVYQAGGRSLYVREWKTLAQLPVVDVPVEPVAIVGE